MKEITKNGYKYTQETFPGDTYEACKKCIFIHGSKACQEAPGCDWSNYFTKMVPEFEQFKNFAVTTKIFSLYEAFKKEAEKIGWKYDVDFSCFQEGKMSSRNCLHFKSQWRNTNLPMFSMTNVPSDTKVFQLETEFEEALEFAKNLFPKKVTYADILESCKINISSPLMSTSLGEKISFQLGLHNVAAFLNPDNKPAYFSIRITEGKNFIISSGFPNVGQPKFLSEDLTKKAIEILGEEAVIKALS